MLEFYLNILYTLINILPSLLVLTQSLISLKIYSGFVNSYMKRYVIFTSAFMIVVLIMIMSESLLLAFCQNSYSIMNDFSENFNFVFDVFAPLRLILTILLIVWIVYINFRWKDQSRPFYIISIFIVSLFLIWMVIGQQVIGLLDDVLRVWIVF